MNPDMFHIVLFGGLVIGAFGALAYAIYIATRSHEWHMENAGIHLVPPDIPKRDCPDCGRPLVRRGTIHSCDTCDVHVDRACEDMDKSLGSIDMERLHDAMVKSGRRSMTMDEIHEQGFLKK